MGLSVFVVTACGKATDGRTAEARASAGGSTSAGGAGDISGGKPANSGGSAGGNVNRDAALGGAGREASPDATVGTGGKMNPGDAGRDAGALDGAHSEAAPMLEDAGSGEDAADRDAAITPEPIRPPAGLEGLWVETARLRCPAIPNPNFLVELPVEQPIGELAFRGNQSFGVTWAPFETYVDYWGDVRYDPQSGRLDLIVDETVYNYLPDDVDPSGWVLLDGEDLLLIDIWLGSPQYGEVPVACGHRFRPY